jgi:hypothetical protein
MSDSLNQRRDPPMRVTYRWVVERLFRFLGESRATEREIADHRVILSWYDRHGEGFAQGTCRDISQHGIGVECVEPIPLKAAVVVRQERGGGVSAAVIRHRAQHGSTYIIGLEFTSAASRARPGGRDELA